MLSYLNKIRGMSRKRVLRLIFKKYSGKILKVILTADLTNQKTFPQRFLGNLEFSDTTEILIIGCLTY